MAPVRGAKLSPSQQRRMKQSREAPLGWGELLATVCLVGTMGGAAFWLCCKILAWASASPTMILMRPD